MKKLEDNPFSSTDKQTSYFSRDEPHLEDNPFSSTDKQTSYFSRDEPQAKSRIERWRDKRAIIKPNNFMICAHGQLSLNSYGYVDEFQDFGLDVFTFAPPTESCIYPPDSLLALKDALHENNRQLGGTIDSFIRNILKIEKETLGYNFCGADWIGAFAKERGFDSSKACSLQTNTIQDKYFVFEDSNIEIDLFGIWDLKTNRNIMIDLIKEGIPYNEQGGNIFYQFSEIIKLMKIKYNYPIRIFDCSCSHIFNESGKITDPRTQRRIQRNIKRAVISKGKQNKIKLKSKTKKSKKSKKYTLDYILTQSKRFINVSQI